MSEPHPLAPGLYERLVDQNLTQLLASQSGLLPSMGRLEDEDSPEVFGQFVSHLVTQALRTSKPVDRLALVNKIVGLLAGTEGLAHFSDKALVEQSEKLLLSLQYALPDGHADPLPRPVTPLSVSCLLTGARRDPQLEHELRQEMLTADRVDILVSFVKWSGLRLLQPAFEALETRGVEVRLVTTSYMGASDPAAIEWLAARRGLSVKISYDTERTRLHAKAYLFTRKSGYSTAYIGSANMSQAAMTSGLEWTVKATQQDMAHLLQRFEAEFSTYWASPEFEVFNASQSERLSAAIDHAKNQQNPNQHRFFADIKPRSFQERILEALLAARNAGQHRNLVVAATGTGKTVISAFDYARLVKVPADGPNRPALLFIAHRREILEQARDCFRTVLRDGNFGELFVGGEKPQKWRHVFASVQSIQSAEVWLRLGSDHFRYIVLDEAHHIAASSYRPILDHFRPGVLLGLTATPERMDGSSILPDFGGEFAAEIRLPEALEEKLLCPFHYFGITDPISLADESFWRSGKYDLTALTDAYTGDDVRARQRLDVVLASLRKYQPDLSEVRGVGFCVSVKHAVFMADAFRQAGFRAEVVVGETAAETRAERVQEFRQGRLPFLFTVDVFSEGIDVPEINLVMFLRPTESLTVFLQQLGRGLRNSRGKDCLTVLDFIGQCHRRYRIDRKFAVLMTKQRQRIDTEVEEDFPHLPPGCNIQLEPVAREHVLNNIKTTLRDFATMVTESIATFEQDHGLALSFINFVRATGVSELALLKSRTWSEWKALAAHRSPPEDMNNEAHRQALRRILLRTEPRTLVNLASLAEAGDLDSAIAKLPEADALRLHYLLWARKGPDVGAQSPQDSLRKWLDHAPSRSDLSEVVAWRSSQHALPTSPITLPFDCPLELHAAYGSAEIKAALGLSTFGASGQTGVGVMHKKVTKFYVHLVTFRKSERDFSQTTRYRDYPVSRTRLHWESESGTTRESVTGQNYLHFKERGYTILFFARLEKRIEDETAPFLFLGPARELVSAEGDRPISMDWDLEHPIPAALFEDACAA
jgi:superfamily II DNA or RNA helicase/HKD family nuclease